MEKEMFHSKIFWTVDKWEGQGIAQTEWAEKCLLKAQIHNLKASPCAVILSLDHQLPDNYTEASY